jgi:adenylate cyclase
MTRDEEIRMREKKIATLNTMLAVLREGLPDRIAAGRKQAADPARRRRLAIAVDLEIDTTPRMASVI